MSIQSRPTVSVIIPTYNRARVLGRSIESVLAQTYRDFELIIVDDGSTDNTEEVVQSLNYPHIRFIRQEKNRGFAAALNIGIKTARGEYIALLDSDDEWLPAKLEKQMALFNQDKKGDLGLVLCEVLTSGRHGESLIVPRINLLSYEKLLMHRRDGGYCTLQFLIKRSLAGTELYLDENLTFSGDWDLLVRLAPLCRIDYVPEPLGRIHVSADSMSLNNINRLKTSLKILEKYRAELEERPAALGSNYFDIALNYHLAGQEMHQVRHYLIAAIRTYPWFHTQYFALAFSVLGHTGMRWFLKLKGFITNPIKQIKILINRRSLHLIPESEKSKTGNTLKSS